MSRRFTFKRLLTALLTVLVLGLLATTAINFHFTSFASERIVASAKDAPKKPVAIVLGARVYNDGSPSVALSDRLTAALELYQTGKVERILVSGDHGQSQYDEVNAMREWLLAHGVPNKDIFMDHAGFRTYDTMRRAKEVFQIDSAIICTQEYHLPRSLRLAEYAGIDAVGVVADRRVYPHARGNAVREFAARQAAFLDMLNPWSNPRHLGPPIPIHGDASQTHDHKTRVPTGS